MLVETFEIEEVTGEMGIMERFQDRDTMGRYIVGQCMSAFAINMPPHPIAITFADKYFNLPKST